MQRVEAKRSPWLGRVLAAAFVVVVLAQLSSKDSGPALASGTRNWSLRLGGIEQQQQQQRPQQPSLQAGGRKEDAGTASGAAATAAAAAAAVAAEQAALQAEEASAAASEAAAAAAALGTDEEREGEGEEGRQVAPAEQQPLGEQQPRSPYHAALAQCRDLPCLTAAAKLERHPGQFRFPHFFIVGWQKCATTALFGTLIHHPQVLSATIKEPEFFSYDCEYDAARCPPEAQREYLFETMQLQKALDADLRLAAVEGSTHYGRQGHALAPSLARVLPWLRIIVSLREPISRALSMLAHAQDIHDRGCLTEKDVHKCLKDSLKKGDYFTPFQAWMEAFPPEQVYLIQYENMTAKGVMEDVVADVKDFLGLDPEAGRAKLHHVNTREQHLIQRGELTKGEEAEGWPMSRHQYEELVALVRPDAQKVADLAARHGLIASARQWMRAWEAVWEATLEACDDDGNCMVDTK